MEKAISNEERFKDLFDKINLLHNRYNQEDNYAVRRIENVEEYLTNIFNQYGNCSNLIK